jgi:hypothetical protein
MLSTAEFATTSAGAVTPNAPELSRSGLCELLNQTAACRRRQLLVRYSLRDTMPVHKRFDRMDAAPG